MNEQPVTPPSPQGTVSVSIAAPGAPPGPLREFWTAFSANAGAVAGLVIVLVVLLMAAFAPWLAPHAPYLTDSTAFLRPPVWADGGSWSTPLGTDAIGRDMLSRLIYGARLSLTIGLAVVALSIVVGIVLGLGAAAGGAAKEGHADLEGQFEFQCATGGRAGFVEVRLFEAFAGFNRIDLQVATPRGQMQATLRRPQTRVSLAR